ncbi:MAG: helix-turn-helix domain-containing protein [Candidatus Thermoplasmatota archaeon]
MVATGLLRADLGIAREQILAAVHDLQPATLQQIQAATGLSRGNLRHHLRVLASHGLVESGVPHGHARKNRAYHLCRALELAGAEFQESCPVRVQPRQARPTVNSSPVRRAVLERLLHAGPATYEELRDHLVRSGVVDAWPHSTASFHLRKLVDAESIVFTRERSTKTFAANLVSGQAAALAERVRPRPGPEPASLD